MNEQKIPDYSSEELDLEQAINLLDQAFMSNDPRIRECLKRLMVVVALCETGVASDRNRPEGPLRRLINDVHSLYRRIDNLERQLLTPQNRYYEHKTWTTDHTIHGALPIGLDWGSRLVAGGDSLGITGEK
jgi:hypothetical protein